MDINCSNGFLMVRKGCSNQRLLLTFHPGHSKTPEPSTAARAAPKPKKALSQPVMAALWLQRAEAKPRCATYHSKLSECRHSKGIPFFYMFSLFLNLDLLK